MTIGHTVTTRRQFDLDPSRDHEQGHVAQYERSGLLFVSASFCCALAHWFGGNDPYRDNLFEREAYGVVGPCRRGF